MVEREEGKGVIGGEESGVMEERQWDSSGTQKSKIRVKEG